MHVKKYNRVFAYLLSNIYNDGWAQDINGNLFCPECAKSFVERPFQSR